MKSKHYPISGFAFVCSCISVNIIHLLQKICWSRTFMHIYNNVTEMVQHFRIMTKYEKQASTYIIKTENNPFELMKNCQVSEQWYCTQYCTRNVLIFKIFERYDCNFSFGGSLWWLWMGVLSHENPFLMILLLVSWSTKFRTRFFMSVVVKMHFQRFPLYALLLPPSKLCLCCCYDCR